MRTAFIWSITLLALVGLVPSSARAEIGNVSRYHYPTCSCQFGYPGRACMAEAADAGKSACRLLSQNSPGPARRAVIGTRRLSHRDDIISQIAAPLTAQRRRTGITTGC
jgi:hypothetical protein